uniref:protein phosphatase methylesterase-1 n=1 Tax=Angiostrongylus cantonensis TaxID=6313 RepID=A0A0K0CZ75_ANGCA
MYGDSNPHVLINLNEYYFYCSMGGALAIHVAATNEIPNMVGLVVIDVVEGSAMDALSGMLTFLRGRPAVFDSEEKAVAWCLQSGTTRNRQAARISMPSQIRKMDDGKYTWRIDLTTTEPFWVGWFQGLSSKFLSCLPPKLLVLAGIDRLDKELTVETLYPINIAQMQGKFQNTILPKVGHAVQEDSPDRLADELSRFAIRNRFAEALPGVNIAAARPLMGMGMMI